MVSMPRRVATTNPDRTYTRVVFVDAVEPKKPLDAPATAAHPFPDTIDVEYELVPNFIPGVDPASSDNETATRDLQLPTTVIPDQVLKNRRRRNCTFALPARSGLLPNCRPPALPVAGILRAGERP